jgi:hypothetical protein
MLNKNKSTGCGDMTPPMLYLSTSRTRRSKVSFTPHLLWPWGDRHQYSLNSGLGGSHGLSGHLGVHRNLFPLLEIKPPVPQSSSLSWLHYPLQLLKNTWRKRMSLDKCFMNVDNKKMQMPITIHYIPEFNTLLVLLHLEWIMKTWVFNAGCMPHLVA